MFIAEHPVGRHRKSKYGLKHQQERLIKALDVGLKPRHVVLTLFWHRAFFPFVSHSSKDARIYLLRAWRRRTREDGGGRSVELRGRSEEVGVRRGDVGVHKSVVCVAEAGGGG